MCPLHLEILGVKGKVPGFNLLLGFDAIKKQGEDIVHLTESGEIHSLVENLLMCAVIKIDEHDFNEGVDHLMEMSR